MPWFDPKDRYRSGQYKQVCDQSGFVVYSGWSKRQWNGLVVRESDWDPKHPQLDIQGKRDYQAPPNPSPEGPDTFLSAGDVTPDDL